MRKILSPEEEDKKRKKKQLTIGIVLIGIMAFSIFGYGFIQFTQESEDSDYDSGKFSYNGYTFVNQNDYWVVEIGGKLYSFKYLPNEVEKINSNLNNIDSYSGKPLYIDSQIPTIGEAEITRNLYSLSQRIQKACYETNKNCSEKYPIKNCTSNLIILQENSASRVVQEDNCIFIQGSQENLPKMADAFLYNILDIN